MAADAAADTEAVPARKIAPDDDDTGADVEVRSAAGSFWSELGWMGLAAPVLFGLVGAAMAWLGINALQLYAYSSAHRSTWEAKRVESWGDAGFDVSGVTTGYAAVEWTPRPVYDFEHSDNYKYARLLSLYHRPLQERPGPLRPRRRLQVRARRWRRRVGRLPGRAVHPILQRQAPPRAAGRSRRLADTAA